MNREPRDRNLVLVLCYGALFLNISATISSFILTDNLGELEYNAAKQNLDMKISHMVGRETTILKQYWASASWNLMLYHCTSHSWCSITLHRIYWRVSLLSRAHNFLFRHFIFDHGCSILRVACRGKIHCVCYVSRSWPHPTADDLLDFTPPIFWIQRIGRSKYIQFHRGNRWPGINRAPKW